jgi:nucleotide-binding universal stress UspA family protein
VTLVHVADDEWGAIGSVLIDEVNQDAMQRLADEVGYARSIDPDASVHAELRLGSPMTELASYRDAETMIVVGAHETEFHHGRAFGARSLQLASLATGPVAIISATASPVHRGVVVGVDDTPAGLAAIDLAADWAGERHCELTAVRSSVAEPPRPTGAEADTGPLVWPVRHDEEARVILDAAVRRIRERQPRVIVRRRLVRRPASAALREFARDAELLVIGDSHRAEPQSGGLGDVAYNILLGLSSPTIVVHAPLTGIAPDEEQPHEQQQSRDIHVPG